MAVTKAQKKETLAELEKAFKAAKAVVFSQYQGTNVKNMRELRKRLHEKKVDFKVARKTLILLAAKTAGFSEIPPEYMQGPIGLAFANGDEMAAAKIVHEFAKTAETVRIAGAILEGKLIPASEVRVLAALPGKEVLISQLVGLMKSPISGFYGVLHGVLGNFVRAVAEVSKKKPQDTAAAVSAS